MSDLQTEHLFGHGFLDMFYQYLRERMADEVLVRDEVNLTRGARNGKRTHQFALRVTELERGELGDKSHPEAAFHHVHKGFQASHVIGRLVDFHLLALAKAHQLVAKAMPFVEEPKPFVANVGGADDIVLEDRFIARDITKEFFVVKARAAKVLFRRLVGNDGGIDFPFREGGQCRCRLHLLDADIKLLVLFGNMLQKARKKNVAKSAEEDRERWSGAPPNGTTP